MKNLPILVNDGLPKGTILFVPPVTLNHYINYATGEVKDYISFNPKATGIIENIKIDD